MKHLSNFILEYNTPNKKTNKIKSIYGSKNDIRHQFPQEEWESDDMYRTRIESYLAIDKDDVKRTNDELKAKWINPPFQTVIYNKGPKNKNWRLTLLNMSDFMKRYSQPFYTYEEIGSFDDKDKKWEFNTKCETKKPEPKGMIMDLCPEDICFTDEFSYRKAKELTHDFTKVPEIEQYIYVHPPYYGDEDPTGVIQKVLDSYSDNKYFQSGKLEVTIMPAPEGMDKDYIYMKVTNAKFLRDKEERIKWLSDLDRIKAKKIRLDKEWADAAAKAEKEREAKAAAAAKAEAARKKAEEEDRAKMNAFLDKMRKEGATEEEIEKAKEEWGISNWLDQYGNQD